MSLIIKRPNTTQLQYAAKAIGSPAVLFNGALGNRNLVSGIPFLKSNGELTKTITRGTVGYASSAGGLVNSYCAVPSVTSPGTPFTIIAEIVLDANAGSHRSIITLSGGGATFLNISNASASDIDLKTNNETSNILGTGLFTQGKTYGIVVSYTGSIVYFWVSGVLIGTISTTNISPTLISSGYFMLGDGFFNFSNKSPVSLAAYYPGSSFSIEWCRDISINPWNIFPSIDTPIFVSLASAISSITLTSTGDSTTQASATAVITTGVFTKTDVSTTGWTGSPDNVVLSNNINEVTSSTAEYIQSPPITGSQGPADFDLNNSLGVGTWEVDVTFKYTLSAADVKFTLLNAGGTSVGDSGWIAASSVFAGYTPTITISSGTATKLRVEVQ